METGHPQKKYFVVSSDCAVANTHVGEIPEFSLPAGRGPG
jgi:hypothetical protein